MKSKKSIPYSDAKTRTSPFISRSIDTKPRRIRSDAAGLSFQRLVLLPVVVDVLNIVMLGTKSPVGRFRNPLKIKHFQDLRLSKVANSVLLVCHSSSDKIKYNWIC